MFIYIKALPESGATLYQTPQAFTAKIRHLPENWSILNTQRNSFNDETERLEPELRPKYWRFRSIPFFGNRGRGNCGAVPHKADPANAGRPPAPLQRHQSLFPQDQRFLVQPSRLTRCLAVPEEDSCGEVGKQRISICRR